MGNDKSGRGYYCDHKCSDDFVFMGVGMVEIKLNDWLAEGKKRFGEDIKKWQFVCPACKTVQTPQDLLDAGVGGDDVDRYIAFSCIGRFTEGKKGTKGCDWTLGGFFQVHKTLVDREDGTTRRVFEFAEAKVS